MTSLDKEFMEELYKADKILLQEVNWEQDSQNPHHYSAEAPTQLTDGDTIMTLHGEYWEKAYSFVLRYQNEIIRVWDCLDHHEGIEGGHKHEYVESNDIYSEPYSVSDVSTSDVNQGIKDFLDECRIEKNGYAIGGVPGLDK